MVSVSSVAKRTSVPLTFATVPRTRLFRLPRCSSVCARESVCRCICVGRMRSIDMGTMLPCRAAFRVTFVTATDERSPLRQSRCIPWRRCRRWGCGTTSGCRGASGGLRPNRGPSGTTTQGHHSEFSNPCPHGVTSVPRPAGPGRAACSAGGVGRGCASPRVLCHHGCGVLPMQARGLHQNCPFRGAGAVSPFSVQASCASDRPVCAAATALAAVRSSALRAATTTTSGTRPPPSRCGIKLVLIRWQVMELLVRTP